MNTIGGRTVADWFLLVRVAVASLAGGLSAVGVLWIVEGDLGRPELLLLLVVLVAALVVFALAALVSDRRGPPDAGAGGHPSSPRPAAHPLGPPVLPAPVPGREPTRSAQDRGWSETAPALPAELPVFTPPPPVRRPATTPPTVQEHPVPGAPPGAAVRRIVQCPRCGDFGVDLRREVERFTMTCHRCAHGWTRGPGRPWPATVVRPPEAECGLPPDPVIRRRSP